MRLSMRFALNALLAALVLALGTSSAWANRIIEIRGAERGVVSSGVVTFNEPRLPAETAITCDITILKTISNRIPKTRGTLFGKVTGIAIDRGTPAASHCRLGAMITRLEDIVPLSEARIPGVHRELGNGILLYTVTGGRPELWKLIYDGFQGELPEIEGINYHIQGAQLRANFSTPFGALACLYAGSWFKLIVIDEFKLARFLRLVLERTILARQEGGLLCPAQLTASGTLTLTPQLSIALL